MHQPIRALLVTDQRALAQVVTLALSHGAYLTQIAVDTQTAQVALHDWHPHIAVIDLDLAEGEILCSLGYRVGNAQIPPVIALTRRLDLGTKLWAFEQGVDDLLTIPFSPEELTARMLVIVRRTYREAEFTPVLLAGELEIDLLKHRVRIRGVTVHLTSLEQSLLYLLAANAGRVLTRDEILTHIWGADYEAESNVVDRHIQNLRGKLRHGWERSHYITTVPGQGYLFVPAPTTDTPPPLPE